jgi:hypothetical protein
VRAVLMIGVALTASSCATFTEQDVVASSGGHELDESTLAEMLESPVAPAARRTRARARSTASRPGKRTRGDQPVGRLRAIRDAGLLDRGALDASRQQLETELERSLTDSPASMQDLLVDLAATQTLQQEGAFAGGEIDVAVATADISVSPAVRPVGRRDAASRAARLTVRVQADSGARP